MGMKIKYPIPVLCDNFGSIYFGYNANMSQQTKHVNICYKYVNEYVKNGMIKVVFVRSENNDADVFTKNTNEVTYLKQKSKFVSEKNVI